MVSSITGILISAGFKHLFFVFKRCLLPSCVSAFVLYWFVVVCIWFCSTLLTSYWFMLVSTVGLAPRAHWFHSALTWSQTGVNLPLLPFTWAVFVWFWYGFSCWLDIASSFKLKMLGCVAYSWLCIVLIAYGLLSVHVGFKHFYLLYRAWHCPHSNSFSSFFTQF